VGCATTLMKMGRAMRLDIHHRRKIVTTYAGTSTSAPKGKVCTKLQDRDEKFRRKSLTRPTSLEMLLTGLFATIEMKSNSDGSACFAASHCQDAQGDLESRSLLLSSAVQLVTNVIGFSVSGVVITTKRWPSVLTS